MLRLQTEDDLYRCMLAVAVAYLVAAYLIGFIRAARRRGATPSGNFAIIRLFDGVTFSASLMLLAGVADPAVPALLGSIKPFLMIAGMAGVLHTLHGLFAAA